ncbi:efflux RND transporter permease subunit [Anaeromyxobacter sp. Fw109-5]|uniref:efflux RND transporter permease subunit n=1 Tax=Anaeromyxobacter sp. (strain Fw109-5) TaxID=404589 RepID=UPI0000ED7721|nr:efflux RND transporter permease subunit [Anaeromyxobacter sp. Fw109-5]ABS24456.1 acriflavin resistance protein [Anaeromyxobacter sp. Fw109-5]
MLISDFAIKKPIVTVTVMLALVIFGLIALVALKTDEFPDVQPPVVAVTIVYPGASPETVERELIDPIEDAIFSISGIDGEQTTASATDGLAQFIVFFDFEKDLQEATQDIRDAISEKRADLPLEMEEPIITRFDPADEPIVSLTLTSGSIDVPSLTRLADEVVSRELRAVQGVADVRLVGGRKRELTVELNPQAMAAAGVSASDVVGALQAQNLAAPVGRVNTPLGEQSIRLSGRLQTPDEFAAIAVATRGGQVVRLGQLGSVKDGAEEPRTLALYDTSEAVGLEVLKTKGYSTTAVADEIKARAKALEPRLPKAAKLQVVQDAGERVRRSVNEVQTTLVEGALLTVLVVFFFLNSWRSTVITGLALPVSVLAAFISVWMFGFTLNTMSLLGLSLAIGILIDDAIVVRENIVRHIELGEDHTTASFKGTDEIGLAVAATTFSIVSVFVPVAFMYGVAGQWFKPFALTIAAAVLVSLFVSFSLDPMMSAYWPDPQIEKGQARGPVGRALGAFNAWFDRQADRYKGVVAWALDHRWTMIALAGLSFFGAIFLQGAFGGAGFVPISDRSEVNLIVQTPPGSSLDYTRAKVEEANAIVRSHPEVKYVYSSIGTPIPLQAPGVDQALVYVRLVPKADRARSQEELGTTLRRELKRVAGAEISVFTSGFGGAFKSIQLELRGPDSRVLAQYAEKVKAVAQAVPGAVDVGLSTRGQKPELEVAVNRGLAGNLGVTVGQVAQSLRIAFAGLDSGDWVDPTGETRDVMVRLAPEARERAVDLRQLPLVLHPQNGGNPQVVPLGQVATVREGLGPAQIAHLDRERVINIQGNVAGRSLTEVVQDIERRLGAEVKLPPGYTIRQGGESRDQQEVFMRVGLALLLAVLLMYLILVLQFGSFLDPLAILLSLPLSLIGVVGALLLTGDTLNIMSLIGVILLFGIVAKNAILLIDFAKWAREERGISIRDALVEAGRIRLRPIMMTSVAIIAGMIPVALGAGEGGDFRAPLGRAVIGGVITSTLLTLLVIPTVYEIMDSFRERALRGFRRLLGGGRGGGNGTSEPAPAPHARAGGVRRELE